MSPSKTHDFNAVNAALTKQVVERIEAAGAGGAVLAEAPPGAGKSTLTVSVARQLIKQDRRLNLAIVTQTNEQADDLTHALLKKVGGAEIARMHSSGGPSSEMVKLADAHGLRLGTKTDAPDVSAARIVVSTARKWQYERSRLQGQGTRGRFRVALIDEAYQMRSDMLLGVASLYDTLFCVGDPGQLDPFTVIDDAPWKGLSYSPSRAALATLRAYHADLEPILLPLSWRLPPSAASVISAAFYPANDFTAGTKAEQRELRLGAAKRWKGPKIEANAILEHAAATGWGYVELPEKVTVRADEEIASTLAGLVALLQQRGAQVIDELTSEEGRALTPAHIAVVTAHNDQVHAVRYALAKRKIDPDALVVSTANKIQGREYDVVFVWHPLAGRRDATAFHLESGRMCVMLSRHRHACVVVGRAGADLLLAEFPDSDPIFLDEPEKFPDGWQANYTVLEHLKTAVIK